jgi:hypothetical protein
VQILAKLLDFCYKEIKIYSKSELARCNLGVSIGILCIVIYFVCLFGAGIIGKSCYNEFHKISGKFDQIQNQQNPTIS